MDRSIFPGILALLLAAPVTLGQDPVPDPDLGERLSDLKKMVKDRRMERDPAAAALIQTLSEAYPKMHPKDQDKVSSAVGRVFFDGTRRPADATLLYHGAADALAVMGEDGAKHLKRALEHNRLGDADYLPLRVALIEALGRTGDLAQVDWLLDEARRSPHDDIMAAAGGALGGFRTMELRQRREVVKDLIRRWGELEAKGSQLDPLPTQGGAVDFSGQNARRTLNKIRPKWKATLRTLTGRSFNGHPDWQHWLNKEPDWQRPAKGR